MSDRGWHLNTIMTIYSLLGLRRVLIDSFQQLLDMHMPLVLK